MNQLFYNIAGGIVHKIRTTISQVIVHGKLTSKDQTDQFVICLVLPVYFCQNCILPSDSEANRDGADAAFPFPFFISFSA